MLISKKEWDDFIFGSRFVALSVKLFQGSTQICLLSPSEKCMFVEINIRPFVLRLDHLRHLLVTAVRMNLERTIRMSLDLS